MKICFTTFACPTWSLRRIIRAAQTHHYHGVEIRCDANHDHGVEIWTSPSERKLMRKQLDKAEVELPCLATSLQFNNDAIIEEAMPRLELASDIGARGMRIFFGKGPQPDADIERSIDRACRQLSEFLPYAESHGVDIWIETHDLLSSGPRAAEVVRRLNHPRLGVCYNNLHPIRSGEALATTLGALRGMIRHVHFHDGRDLPDQVIVRRIGQGDMPIEETLEALLRSGYKGYLSGEWFYDQLGTSPEESLDAYMFDVRQLTHRHGVALGVTV